MPTNPPTTLATIRTKVRKLTHSPSTISLPDATLDNYINTFVAYDMPDHLKLFDTSSTFSFYCVPFQDVYLTDISIASTNVLYDFQNKYSSIDGPLYIAGYEIYLSQLRTDIYRQYPINNNIQQIAVGNGTQTIFSGTLSNVPILPNEVTFTSVATDNTGLTLIDNGLGGVYTNLGTTDAGTGNFSTTVPGATFEVGQQFYIGTTIFTVVVLGTPGALLSTGTATGTYNTTTGALVITGNNENPSTVVNFSPVTLTDPLFGTSVGTINYTTGYFSLIFGTAPLLNQGIDAQTVPYVPARPIMMLYYDNKFTLRPVPDQPYKITFNAFKRPTAILSGGDNPQLQDWWQYIAYGAAKKIFEDRMDMESVQLIMSEFKTQELLVLRKTITNQAKERTATIYSEQTSLGPWGWNRFF